MNFSDYSTKAALNFVTFSFLSYGRNSRSHKRWTSNSIVVTSTDHNNNQREGTLLQTLKTSLILLFTVKHHK